MWGFDFIGKSLRGVPLFGTSDFEPLISGQSFKSGQDQERNFMLSLFNRGNLQFFLVIAT